MDCIIDSDRRSVLIEVGEEIVDGWLADKGLRNYFYLIEFIISKFVFVEYLLD